MDQTVIDMSEKTEQIDFKCTPAFKASVDQVAARRQISRSAVIRQALSEGLSAVFPEFLQIYESEVLNG